MGARARMDGRRPPRRGDSRLALDDLDREVDRDCRVGPRHRCHRHDRRHRGAADGGAGSRAHTGGARARRRAASRPGRGSVGRMAAASRAAPQRCVRKTAHRCLVEPRHQRRRSHRPVFLPGPHLPLDVDHRWLARVVRPAVAQTDAGPDPGRRRLCNQCVEPAEGSERLHARGPRLHPRASAVDQLHGLDRECGPRQRQAERRRAVGLLGERACRHGRADRARHHAASAFDRRPNARRRVRHLHQLGAAPGAAEPSRIFRQRRRVRRDRVL